MADEEIPRITAAIQSLQLYTAYGHFMLAWACFDELIEVFIQRQTRMSFTNATIVLSGLGFERKASIARSLMSLHGDNLNPARLLLNKIVAEAERNAIVHGHLLNVESPITLAKRTTDQKLTVKIIEFDGDTMLARVRRLSNLAKELQNLLGITNEQIRRYDKMTRNLASKSATSPKPPSS